MTLGTFIAECFWAAIHLFLSTRRVEQETLLMVNILRSYGRNKVFFIRRYGMILFGDIVK